ncbi:hypothetical protein V1J52_02455 [Streptomyces sp. TRM 70351]|uniref:hypothetical protein n=1 Tax=Streptomyces sp. TRM 70351 TaxID=3116552 RepID=UPI002E7B86D1|nr:hypothetical protein [Streptomyces sp. TRM 70351]MEE1927052.1 hypothetical protein [Streptomyces sp. TRM 70351]
MPSTARTPASGTGTGTDSAGGTPHDGGSGDDGERRDDGTPGAPPPAGHGRSGRPRRLRRPVAVIVLLALLGAGSALWLHARALTGSPAAGNGALTRTAATDRVTGEVSDALTRVFSYGPGTLDRTGQAADETLAGTAAREYRALFAQVEERVAEQELSLVTRVVRVGVSELTDDRATLLAFLDQTASRPGQEPSATGAQLTVVAELRGDRWRITDMTPR